jgi:hypothetical protein
VAPLGLVCVPGTGVCGTPEPGLGVAGLFCAQASEAHSTRAEKRIGERCIVTKTPVSTQLWMQRAAAQMAGCISKVKKLWSGYPT